MSEDTQLKTFRAGCRGFGHKIMLFDIEAKNWQQAMEILKTEMKDAKPILVRVK